VQALPSGSFLVLSHGTWDFMPPAMISEIIALPAPRTGVFQTRTRQEIERFFTGLQLIPPGIGPINRWHADHEPTPRPTDEQTAFYGAIGRIP
jgi:hypothetical protein